MTIQIKKFDLDGKEAGTVEISEELVGTVGNLQMIKDYLVAMRTNKRQWSAHTKTRAEVAHSGQKPHAQKGTGKARQGYLGAPQYKGGGRVHAPRAKFDQHVSINRKEKKAAIRHLLCEKIREGHLCLLTDPVLQGPKTKRIDQFLSKREWEGKRVLFLAEAGAGAEGEKYGDFVLSMRNIPKVSFMALPTMSGYEAILNEKLVVMESAFKELTRLLGE